jgi:class 3 adenylate cyclase/tetratricopeptide (TPR) repeat protein
MLEVRFGLVVLSARLRELSPEQGNAMNRCLKCVVQLSAEARFCHACGTAVSVVVVRELRKTITVLFCDVKGSTGLGERLQPETFREVFTRYFETARLVLEAHGGTVYPQIGDGILAVFGVPKLHEDDALRAVRAAVEMREALSNLNQDLKREWALEVEVRIGINTGEVAVEDDGRGQPTLLGDPINIAARLEKRAEAGEIVLGELTWSLVRGAVSVESLGQLPLRGRSAPVGAYRLTLLSTPDEEAQRLDAALVGRDREMAWLRLAYERTERDRTCHLVTLLGSVGVGKSRLVAEFSTTLAHEATILRGRCLPYGDGITFWPISVAIRQAAGIRGDDPPEAARARLSMLVGEQERSDQIAAQVAQLLVLDEPGAIAEDSIFWGVRRLLETLAGRRPVILVIEDLHWAEPTLLDLIEHVADHSRDVPILIICLAREVLLEDRPTWGGGKLNATSLLLAPLTDNESHKLITELFTSTPPSTAKAIIARVAEGNPLFIEELVASARDDERLLTALARTTADGSRGEGAVPPAIHAVLAARLERLEPEERTVLERAAVVGVNFAIASVLGLSEDMSRGQVTTILDALIRKQLIRPHTSDLPSGEAFRFRHGLIKDTTYAAISKGSRAVLHERLANWQDRALGNRAREIDAIIGYHLSEAYRYRAELGPPDEKALQLARRAGELLANAGRRASRQGDISATISLLGQAAELLPEDDPVRIEMLIVLAEALGSAGRLTDAANTIDRAISVATRVGDTAKVLRAEIGQLDLKWYTDLEAVLNEGVSKAERAIEVFGQSGDDRGLASAWRVLAQIRYGRGKNAAARESVERAIDAARRAGDQRLEAKALGNACWITLLGPMTLIDAMAHIEYVLEWAERTGSHRLEAHALRVLARAHAMRGDFVRAREFLGAANTITTKLGEVLYGSPDATSAAFVELLAGDYAAAERALRRSLDALTKFGAKNQSAAAAGLLARALLDQGRLAEGEHFAKMSRRNAARNEIDAQVKWRRAQARILASRSRFAYALRLTKEEIALADGTDWIDLQAESRLDMAYVLNMAGRGSEANEIAMEAHRYYEQKGNVVGARLAREFLGDLDSNMTAS